MVRRLCALIALVAGLGPASGLAATAADPTYAALRSLEPDGRRLAVHGLKLERDAFTFEFENGTIHLLAPVDGRTVGAVFVGDGSFTLVPATENERRHLAILRGDEKLEVLRDSFHRLVLWAADDTFDELAMAATLASGPPDAAAREGLAAARDWGKKKFHSNFELRLAEDLINLPGWKSGVFLAIFDGDALPVAAAIVDPQGADRSGLGWSSGGEDTGLFVADEQKGGFWYMSDRKDEIAAGKTVPTRIAARASHYDISTTVSRKDDLAGETTIALSILQANVRVVRLNLMSKLRLQSAESATDSNGAAGAWQTAAFVQEAELEDPDAAAILSAAPPKGSTVRLRLRYAGEGVLREVGEDNYVVGARESWYPNLEIFGSPATFDLTFRIPEKNEVVAVGRLVDSKSEAGATVSRWRTDKPIRVAGFNYGRFKKLERRDEVAGLLLQIFTNPGRPAILRDIDAALRRQQSHDFQTGGVGDLDSPSQTDFNVAPPPSVGEVNTESLAESALVDGINSARVFRWYFGPISTDHVAITQQSQWSFGQSWPSLVFLPYYSFLSRSVLATIGSFFGLQEFKETNLEGLGYHELSHQWWGHEVGWRSYRDQWLSEGFADFSAALVLQHARGWQAYDEFFDQERQRLLERPSGNSPPHYAAGPISLGVRLSTYRDPEAYFAITYAKGAYVLHMLRMMMRGAPPEPDARFEEMMRDYVTTWAGKNPSTADFQRIVEQHLTPELNATLDGKLDWFFRQWIDGTELPKYEAKLAAEKDGDAYRIHGTISQLGVSKDFRALVPIYVAFDKGQLVRVALVPLVGEVTRNIDARGVKLPQKPKRVVINAHFDVLSRD